MSRHKNFLSWIFSKNKKPYYTTPVGVFEGDINNHTKPDGSLAHLEHAPTGWKKIQVKYGRNTNYWGIFRDFTNTLQFGLDGAKILKNIIWNDGYEAQSFFALHKINRFTWPISYDQWYMGELDFTKFKQSKNTCDITVLDGGVAKYLKAYESTTYELSLLDDEAVTVYLDGFPFKNQLEYTVFGAQDFNGANECQIAAGIIVQEGTSQGVLAQDEQYVNSGIVFPDENWLFRSYKKSVILNVEGNLTVNFGGTRTFPIFLKKYKVVNGISVATTYYSFDTGSYGAGVHSVNFSFNIPVDENERVYLVAQGIIGSPGVAFTVNSGTIKMNYEVTFTPTLCRALKLKRIAQLLVAKMTGNMYTCTSAFLDAIDDIVYTSGQGLRDFNDMEAVIKISFADFYKSLKGLDYVNRSGVGVGIENDNLIIENILHFFQPTVVLDLGVIDNLIITVAQDLIANTIKVGYTNQTYDKVNGLDEVNVTQQYTTDVLKIVKELDLIDPVRADPTGIEITRIDLNGKSTTDSKSDNDTFKISVVKGGTLKYYSGTFEIMADNPNIIQIPDILYNLPNGSVVNITGLGAYTITNTSYLVTGTTWVTFIGIIAPGTYIADITYYSAETYIPKRLSYSAISGILQADKKYNIELSPKTNLLNQGAQIHSFLESGKIHFQTGEKNSKLSRTYLSGETITENSDLQVSDLAPKLWLPYYAEFDCEVPLTFKELMDANPYGQISFTHNEVKFYGYLFDGSITPATNDIQKFKLLLAPNNDLKKFI